MADRTAFRIGIDLGGTKIAGALFGPGSAVLAQRRIPTPRQDYAATIEAIAGLCESLRQEAGAAASEASIGIGVPGSLSRLSGVMQNANSTWLNGRVFDRDLSQRLGQPVRLANDANCFALSEATDGAGAGAPSVFGVILGTGCGGGLVLDGRVIEGRRGIGGEWGHNPLPWAGPNETPGPLCWCGRHGCMETWVSGPALEAAYLANTGTSSQAAALPGLADAGDAAARSVLDAHADRLARGLGHVVNMVDPEVIVLGGGLSNFAHLYEVLPGLTARHIFADDTRVTIVPPKWGDASGVRGAAWLWTA